MEENEEWTMKEKVESCQPRSEWKKETASVLEKTIHIGEESDKLTKDKTVRRWSAEKNKAEIKKFLVQLQISVVSSHALLYRFWIEMVQ